MTNENPVTPVKGYRAQSDENLALVNANKEIEERILRDIDKLMATDDTRKIDKRWLSIARTHLEQGFMAYNRAIFNPMRVQLPEDYR